MAAGAAMPVALQITLGDILQVRRVILHDTPLFSA
jgi:hypothetical protein